MYEYKFVKISVGAFSGSPKDDYQGIIHEHARQGWKLHQIFTPPLGAGGQAVSMELIFEKEVANDYMLLYDSPPCSYYLNLNLPILELTS
ncbi:DUF4177 domain-containing protein [Mesobacillus foraminis]|uniref:DUF4177 domain-containing protein n=2 Tax=Mesobacillus foraminis TaxID=279826 RepID=UPI001BE4F3C0|nr:DUF4177 domain-containing protein [Mesobacillus foraminis]MBT2759138.1 DUF4177 domain-containing protein [Mesobacillus foraminis]